MERRIVAAAVLTLAVGSAVRAAETSTAETSPPEPAPPLVRVGKDGFVLQNEEGTYKLRVRALVQVDGRGFLDDADVEGNDAFVIRRARMELEGTLAEQFDFRIMPDFAQGVTSLLDGWLRWNVRPAAQLQIGKMKSPVGLEREQSAENRLFAEFGYPTALVPNRDIGVALRGDVAGRRLNYYVGASNGTSDGASVDADTDDSKTVTLRLLATPFRQSKALEALMFGIAGTYGDSTGGLPSDYRTVGQQFFYRWLKPSATSTGVVLDGEVRRLAPQMYWFVGPFGMMAEYVSSSQELGIDGSLETIENTAWQVGASWVLTGENATYKGVAPERPVAGKGGGGSGAWQLVARYTELDVEDEAFPVFADPALSASAAQTVTVGVNWYATSQVRFLVNYSHTDFDEAASDVSLAEEQALVARTQFRF